MIIIFQYSGQVQKKNNNKIGDYNKRYAFGRNVFSNNLTLNCE